MRVSHSSINRILCVRAADSSRRNTAGSVRHKDRCNFVVSLAFLMLHALDLLFSVYATEKGKIAKIESFPLKQSYAHAMSEQDIPKHCAVGFSWCSHVSVCPAKSIKSCVYE